MGEDFFFRQIFFSNLKKRIPTHEAITQKLEGPTVEPPTPLEGPKRILGPLDFNKRKSTILDNINGDSCNKKVKFLGCKTTEAQSYTKHIFILSSYIRECSAPL